MKCLLSTYISHIALVIAFVHHDFPRCNTTVDSTYQGDSLKMTSSIPVFQPRTNPDLPHCRQILYWLSYQGKPKNTGVGSLSHLSSRRSSWPRNQTGVSCIAGRFFTSWATREAPPNIHETFIEYLCISHCPSDVICSLWFSQVIATPPWLPLTKVTV